MKKILALDLGTKLGWALGEGEGRMSGVNDFSKYVPVERLELFGDFIDGLLTTWQIKTVYFEDVMAHKGQYASRLYGAFWGQLSLCCWKDSIPCIGVGVGTIKKHATGKGNANKIMMETAAREQMGYEGHDDNEADALWILNYAIKQEAKK